jgi:beta-glucosidase
MKKNMLLRILSLCVVITSLIACSSPEKKQNSTGDSEIAKLISEMTVEEKVGQMTQLNLDVVCVGEIYKLEEPHRLDDTKLKKALLEYHVGSILNCGGHAYTREQWLEIMNGIQKVATTETRLKIPVLYGIDAIHGANYVLGSTMFPQQLAQAATFNPELSKKAGEITAYETRSVGIPWNFSPVLDVARNPLWSRFFETFGEDALVCSRFGEATIKGYQGDTVGDVLGSEKVAACMKHFLGYSGMRTGRDRTPAYISDMQLREIYLPSFKKAIETGALTVMINSGEINGIAVHANKKILTDLLRTELKFDGLAVTDWEDIIKLHKNHLVASSLKEAVYQAIEAGIDMCMVPNDYDFTELLIELVKEGRISMERIDLSVERILRTKKKLGILKGIQLPSLNDFTKFGSEEFAGAAKETALQSITLLENRNNILPLNSSQKILVTGPSAHDMAILNGAWSRTWQGGDPLSNDTSKNTIYESLAALSPGNVAYVEGCGLDSTKNMREALLIASRRDVIVACIGELPSTEKPGDIDELDLPRAQIDFVKALIQTGKPVVLVMVENRPRIVREIADQCAAVIMAYQPGDMGGEALADIIMGLANPSGKLPFTYPRHNHNLIWYDHKFTETLDQKFQHQAFNPQWEFGHGLSYSTIEYSSINISSPEMKKGEKVKVSITVTNQSSRKAMESVLLFTHDHFATVTPSVKKLRDFQKIELEAGESKTIEFEIDESDLSFMSEALSFVTEAGDFDIMIGSEKCTLTYLDK